jgi:radical SAM/Cys-rich protein
MKSLQAEKSALSNAATQIEILEGHVEGASVLVPFQYNLEQSALYPLKPLTATVLQINVGKMCNQVCKHCHVDAGPDRKEIMTQMTMTQCLAILMDHPSFTTVDLTGGAPEMNPHFRWFVEEIKALKRHIIVRCNLTIIVANKKYNDLPEFFKKHDVEVVSSLPFYSKERTDKQRGDGVFEDSIRALKMLNEVGYGIDGSGLMLNLVYNPAGAFLPASQSALERDFKSTLLKDFGIRFNNLYSITNLPISRFLDYLLKSGNYEKYMEKLIDAYNPVAAANVMCRTTLSISWDGFIYDCDFNQMLDMKVACQSKHIASFDIAQLSNREIVVNQHCYGCTAGAGSSCGGALS